MSGTPPMETGAAVAEIAGLLNYIEASEDDSKHPMSKAGGSLGGFGSLGLKGSGYLHTIGWPEA